MSENRLPDYLDHIRLTVDAAYRDIINGSDMATTDSAPVA